RAKCDESYLTILLRRFMMRLAERAAREAGAGALITGESLGQVASQTMDALVVTDDATSMPVFRPCIGMDKEDIIKISREIDAFETSILPYEDCCTIFTPQHPKTRPTLERVLEQEARVDVDALIEEAWATRQLVTVTEEF
ncbi:MAG: tRNA 4-thiouridine(8) synthase ThiI, partial [Clostridiales bacterium]|nr:tRNA 4-thiouridine(8) synthase ThiI [Clostridiales bacterium]